MMTSMDGSGRWLDNVARERFWRSSKYEDIHLTWYETASELLEGIKWYTTRYNQYRPHRSLNEATPGERYSGYMGIAVWTSMDTCRYWRKRHKKNTFSDYAASGLNDHPNSHPRLLHVWFNDYSTENAPRKYNCMGLVPICLNPPRYLTMARGSRITHNHLKHADDAGVARAIMRGTDDSLDAGMELYERFVSRVRLFGVRHLDRKDDAFDLVHDVMIIAILRSRTRSR